MSLYDVVTARYGNREEFVDRLRQRMLLHKITQAALSKRSGVHVNNVSRILRGVTKNPELEVCLALDAALDQLITEKASEND